MKFAPGTRDSITDKPYFYVSECGRFYVTVPIRDGEPYIAYRTQPPNSRQPVECLGDSFQSAKAAKAVCENHGNIHGS
jgi:hypothetical protein